MRHTDAHSFKYSNSGAGVDGAVRTCRKQHFWSRVRRVGAINSVRDRAVVNSRTTVIWME